METIEIPDDFYIYKEINGYTYLCYKSCVLINGKLSGCKYINLHGRPVSNKIIDILRSMCDTIDEIKEKTHFVNNKFNNLSYNVHDPYILFYGKTYIYTFISVNDFIEYLDKNYPKCIRNNDIKIALKD